MDAASPIAGGPVVWDCCNTYMRGWCLRGISTDIGICIDRVCWVWLNFGDRSYDLRDVRVFWILALYL